MTLQAQLRLIAAITTLSMLGVILFSVLKLGALRSEFEQYESRQTFSGNLAQIRSAALTVSRSDPILPETGDRLADADRHIQSLHKEATAIAPAEIDTSRLQTVISDWNAYLKGFKGAVEIASTSPSDALLIPDALYTQHMEPMLADIDTLELVNQDGATLAKSNISHAVENIMWIIVLPLIAAAVVVIAFQAGFNRRLKKRIDGIVSVVSHLSAGDLSRRLPQGTADEIGVMVGTLNEFISRIESVLQDAHHSADRSKLTAAKVNLMTQSVSSNANLQSGKIFDVMSAIEKMGATITDIAGKALQAADTAEQTGVTINEMAQVGRATSSTLRQLDTAVAASSHTMQQLEAALQQIGSISDIIGDIAGQTNLLALNAAIEAARAGEQGRGFAVVADEVRLLSERTALSAHNISTLLQTIQASAHEAIASMESTRKGVRTGVTQGEKIGAVLVEVETSMQAVAAMMQQIADATELQSREGQLIAEHISDVTRLTTSTTREIEHTRDEMAGLASTSEVLQGMLAQFRLTHSHQPV